MFDRTMRESAGAEIGRRHPYAIKYGPFVAGLTAVLSAVAGLAGFCWWAAAKLSDRFSGAHVPVPSTGWLVAAGFALLAAVACWLLARLLRTTVADDLRWTLADFWLKLTNR